MWFKKDKDKPVGPVARPVNIERICAVFDENGWTYDFDEENSVLETGFEGLYFRIITNDVNLHVLTTCVSEKLTLERFPEVLAWVEEYHSNNPFPTAVALHDEENNTVRMGADFAIPGKWDYTDAQLMEWLNCGISGILDVCKEFFAAFDPEFLEEIQSANGGEE